MGDSICPSLSMNNIFYHNLHLAAQREFVPLGNATGGLSLQRESSKECGRDEKIDGNKKSKKNLERRRNGNWL